LASGERRKSANPALSSGLLRTIREIAAVAHSDVSDYAAWTRDGRVTLTPSADLGPGLSPAIREIRQAPTGEIQFRLHDKIGALSLLAKIQGLVRDRVEVTGADGGAIETVVLTPAERARRVQAIIRSRGALPPGPAAPRSDAGESRPRPAEARGLLHVRTL
jgi:hypothetical protein